ncbi:MAG TPA: hypothetical protein VE954_08305 [Oligoflexus sp.]|uniref:hypothetical protein n=1 Tax=Oligoflexus sp. TaxID=1971216 RepID=UPI002D54677D|nr:hypothetical protein [Oligoflexus sp.]HYX33105.1 hypothetical protein [Oligoflexus sp.]
MDKLYLIRVDMERFLGPYSLKQVKEAYSRMEFGLQDEVAGSLRQWVAFDDFESIRKHYPELVQLVQREMLSGWGVSTHSAMGTSPLPAKVKAPSKPRSGSSVPVLFILVLVLFVVLGVVGISLYKDGEFGHLVGMIKDRQLYNAKVQYGDQYNAKFEAFMDRNREMINAALKKKKTSTLWLPYVRAVAFEKDGRWDGLSAKKLRGQADGFLPQDCSMGAWEQRWTQSRDQWARFLDGREFPKEEWAYLLALDPHWIRTRTPAPGWLNPGSYAEACLRMAVKAMQRLTGDNMSWEAKVFVSRMRWQIGVIKAQVPDEDFEMSGTLWALSCIEDAREESALKNCLGSVNPKPGWREAFDVSVLQRKIELALTGRNTVEAEQLGALEALVSDFGNRAPNYYLPREPELKFYQEIVQQKGNISDAQNLMQQKYPAMNFQH